jgi:hypothetical protein
MQKPEPSEYSPYFQSYIDLVENGDFPKLLALNKKDVIAFFGNIPEDRHNYKYAEGKWTIKEVLMHIVDTERVFSYRALACARGEKASLPSMDEKLYVENANAPIRTLKSLINEFDIVRENSLELFEHIPDAKSKVLGIIDNRHPITARALGYLLIGHALHHLNVIRERYLLP